MNKIIIIVVVLLLVLVAGGYYFFFMGNPQQTVTGNNGSVSCSTYCAGTGGKSWNNELPEEWLGAKCVGANCYIVKGHQVDCLCERSDSTPYN